MPQDAPQAAGKAVAGMSNEKTESTQVQDRQAEVAKNMVEPARIAVGTQAAETSDPLAVYRGNEGLLTEVLLAGVPLVNVRPLADIPLLMRVDEAAIQKKLSELLLAARAQAIESTNQESEIVADDLFQRGGFDDCKELRWPDFLTDAHMAELFIELYGQDARYCTGIPNGWTAYNGYCWTTDAGGIVELKGHLQSWARFALSDASLKLLAYRTHLQRLKENDAGKIIDAVGSNRKDPEQETLKKLIAIYAEREKFAKRLCNGKTLLNVLDMAQSGLLIRPDVLDNIGSTGLLLNTPVGVVDLKTGKLTLHNSETRKQMHTRCTAMIPGVQGRDLWNDHVEKVTCGDKELAEYLQCAFGMCLIGQHTAEVLIIFKGRDNPSLNGGNGKSTTIEAIMQVMGNYSIRIPADVLTGQLHNPRPTFAELRGTRLAVASETNRLEKLKPSILKELTGRTLTAEPKYAQPFTFFSSHSLILDTNHVPAAVTDEFAMRRRVQIVPFNALFREDGTGTDDAISEYADLLVQKAGPAILQWAIDGAVWYVQHRYKLPDCQAVKEETAQFWDSYATDREHSASSALERFLEECCACNQEYRTKAHDLLVAFNGWATMVGEAPKPSMQAFNSEMAALRRFSRVDPGRTPTWVGVRLIE